MTPGRHGAPSGPAGGSPPSPWLTLTDLGRLYGISALHCGRVLSEAGLRDSAGKPTSQALRSGCAAPDQPCWSPRQCRPTFEAAGLALVERVSLVQQWAELLSALSEGSPSISTSAAQMAEELPGDLVEPVNLQLRQLGCNFQVERPDRRVSRSGGARSAARPESAGPPAPEHRSARPTRARVGGRQAHGASD